MDEDPVREASSNIVDSRTVAVGRNGEGSTECHKEEGTWGPQAALGGQILLRKLK